MLINAPLGYLLCLWIAIVQPVAQSEEVLRHPERAKRWFLFYLCTCVLVLPVWCVLPHWMPFRFELFIFMLTYLASGDADGATSLYHECLRPRGEQAATCLGRITTPIEKVPVFEGSSEPAAEVPVVEESTEPIESRQESACEATRRSPRGRASVPDGDTPEPTPT